MFLHALVQQDKTHLNSIFRLGWKVFGALSRFGGVSSPERKMSEGKRNLSILFHEISMYVPWPALAILKKKSLQKHLCDCKMTANYRKFSWHS